MPRRQPQLAFLHFLTVTRCHKEMTGKLTFAAGVLLIFYIGKNFNNFVWPI